MLTLTDKLSGRYDQHDPVVMFYGIMLDKDCYRVVRCRDCGRIVRVSDCWTYGGPGSLINTGSCYGCK